jgi:glycosyltransferase involved in cell wall biosynthesis
MLLAPEISIIIPTHNRREVLAKSLAALLGQSLPVGAAEIIVVDDGSTDGTGALGERMAAAHETIVFLRQPQRGPGAARNSALRIARAPIVLIMNDDTIASPHMVAEHLASHIRYPEEEVAVLGRITISPEVPRTLFADMHLDATFSTFSEERMLDWHGFITANISAKAAFLSRAGFFDESLFPHEDLELGWRLQGIGLRVRFNPRALGFHFHELREEDYLRMALRDGRSLARWYLAAPELLPELTALGLSGPPPLTLTPKQRAADLALRTITPDFVLRLARAAVVLGPRAARAMYRRVYQFHRRRAIAQELAAVR